MAPRSPPRIPAAPCSPRAPGTAPAGTTAGLTPPFPEPSSRSGARFPEGTAASRTFSTPDAKSAAGDRGRCRVACFVPRRPAGPEQTPAARGGRPSARRPCTPPSRRAPSACRAGSLTPCSELSRGAQAPWFPRPLSRRFRQKALASSWYSAPALSTSPPPYQNFSATLSSAPGATSSAWGWGLRKE